MANKSKNFFFKFSHFPDFIFLKIFLFSLIFGQNATEKAYPSENKFLDEFFIWPFNNEQAKRFQIKVSETLQIPVQKVFSLSDDLSIEFLLIPPGKFAIGTPPPLEPTHTIISCRFLFGLFSLVLILTIFIKLYFAKFVLKNFFFSFLFLISFNLFFSGWIYSILRWRTALKEWSIFNNRIEDQRKFAADHSKIKSREVVIGKPFYLSKFEITQEQYQKIKSPSSPFSTSDKKIPMEVTCDEAVELCKSLSIKTKQKFRLPLETEWEFSCRAGTTTRFYSGDLIENLNEIGWYEKNSNFRLHAVGLKRPNAFGLFDLSGNGYEWCHFWIGYYKDILTEKEHCPDFYEIFNIGLIVRGGGPFSSADDCCSFSRGGAYSATRSKFCFRIVWDFFSPGELKDLPGSVEAHRLVGTSKQL